MASTLRKGPCTFRVPTSTLRPDGKGWMGQQQPRPADGERAQAGHPPHSGTATAPREKVTQHGPPPPEHGELGDWSFLSTSFSDLGGMLIHKPPSVPSPGPSTGPSRKATQERLSEGRTQMVTLQGSSQAVRQAGPHLCSRRSGKGVPATGPRTCWGCSSALEVPQACTGSGKLISSDETHRRIIKADGNLLLTIIAASH